MKIKYLTLSLLLIFIVFTSCKKDNKDENDSTVISKDKITGYIQKGPFTSGTQVTLYDLQSDLSATGKSYNTQISNNTGSFQINNVSLTSNYVSILANGYYFNEVSGSLSNAQLSLTALANVSSNTAVNVNILTHLEKPRVEYLISQGSSFQAAKTQAQQEILQIFNIDTTGLLSSELLDISQGTNGDAILLAVSCILQGYRTEAQLTELLSNIGDDIRTDGVLSSQTLGSELVNHAVYLDTVSIRNNITNRYQALGVTTSIPPFEQYIRHFIQNTSFQITEGLISYPQNGNYGLNVLYPNFTQLNLSDNSTYSLSANLNNIPNAKVKIVLQKLSGNVVWAYANGLSENYSISLFNWTTYEQSFTSVNDGQDCDVSFIFMHDINDSSYQSSGTILVKYYEMNMDAPKWTKNITINP